VSKSVPLISQKNLFLANQLGDLASRKEFQKEKKRFDEAEEIANRNMGASNTLASIFSADLSKYIVKLTSVVFFLKIDLYS